LQHVLPRHVLLPAPLAQVAHSSTGCSPTSRKMFPIQNTTATVQSDRPLSTHTTAQTRQPSLVR
jgi:hypothetical protein